LGIVLRPAALVVLVLLVAPSVSRLACELACLSPAHASDATPACHGQADEEGAALEAAGGRCAHDSEAPAIATTPQRFSGSDDHSALTAVTASRDDAPHTPTRQTHAPPGQSLPHGSPVRTILRI
jgi:hypothetical protein